MIYNASQQDETAIRKGLDTLHASSPEAASALERFIKKQDKYIERLKSQLQVANARLDVARLAKVEIPKLP